MLPTALATTLDTGLASFLRASFWSSTPGMEHVIDDLLSLEGGVSKGPWVELKLPFVQGSKPDFFPAVPLPFNPHAHQERAFGRLGGRLKQSTLVATGTGSGKTESFLIPILAHCEAERRRGVKGVKAVLIYPMNALAADQARRLAGLVHANPRLRGHVRAGMYVGGGKGSKAANHAVMGADHLVTSREVLRADPPDILLTNYKMLDYLLLRPEDRGLWQHNGPGVLRFLVVDELHTFDGAQGTDLACLIRRLKRRLQADFVNLCCVGTSATLGGEEAGERLREYAGQVFGTRFDADSVVDEQRVTSEQFLQDARERFDAVPGREHRAELEPARWSDPESWLSRQAELWLPEAELGPVPESSSEARQAWSVALGDALKEHVVLRRLLDYAAARPTPLGELVEVLQAGQTAWIDDPGLGRLAVSSLLALVSAARRWRPELPAVREQREREGRPRPVSPFIDVRLQGWQRELARMVATVGPRPTLAFSDDLGPAERKRVLPLIHCRDCGAMGWATRRDRDRPHKLGLDGLKSFYRAFFSGDPTVALLWPEGAVDLTRDGWRGAPVLPVDLDDLEVVPPDDERRMARAFRVVQSHSVKTVRRGRDGVARQVLDRACPFCDSPDGMLLVGFRAATVTSVAIDQLFASPFNDDKKLLTFSDSVQDAAHRAGFFGTRTWRINLRVAEAQVLRAVDGEVPLSELPGRVRSEWEARLGPEAFVASFLPTDMAWLHDWTALLEEGSLPNDSELPDQVGDRLAYELIQEHGLRSGIGRSLERTATAATRLDEERLREAVDRLLPVLSNEAPGLRDLTPEGVGAWLRVLTAWLRSRGGILHGELPASFLASGGDKTYAFTRSYSLPNLGPTSRLPGLLVDRPVRGRFVSWQGGGRGAQALDTLVARTLHEGRALGPKAADVMDLAVPILVQLGVLAETEGPQGTRVVGLAPEALRVTSEAMVLHCSRCRRPRTVALVDGAAWQGLPCASTGCAGSMEAGAKSPEDYFRRLYCTGALQRVHSHEHTGLLRRDLREHVESRFKAVEAPPGWQPAPDGSDRHRYRHPWDPNLLSCTPTLEMGIDVGDLSSTILCSVPPAQANYLQRIGRAGRRDGNALVLTVANARPHDLRFYAEPEEMLAGEVQPPGVYLDAAAVLERHLAAFAFDRWVEELGEQARLPARVSVALEAVRTGNLGAFPYPFLSYVQEHRDRLYSDFREMFSRWSAPETLARLEGWLGQAEDSEGGLAARLLELLQTEQRYLTDLQNQARRLASRVDEHEAIPESARADDWAEVRRTLLQEKAAIQGLAANTRKRQLLELLTDRGFLPNYAFPESPVRLESVIWRRKKHVPANGRAYETWEDSYQRSPAQALRELAPFSDFYAGGRKLTIDRVDLSSREVEQWRFCPGCSYASRADLGHPVGTKCPACGNARWKDPGQVLRLLRLKQVYASASDRRSRIGDDRDERMPRFHLRDMLVGFKDEERIAAWQITDPAVPFGVEAFRRARFHDINFGEPTEEGDKTVIDGTEQVRPGYTMCGYCGQVQHPRKEEVQHHPSCVAKKAKVADPLEHNLHLYREFHSEALRLLLPLSDVGVTERLQSFLAALALGLRRRFGGKVGHLRSMTTSTPVPGSNQRKHFVVVYDSVPGGTGYLKQLVTPDDLGRLALFEVFELARDHLRACTCRHSQQPACYRCLLGYRNSREHESISADVAEEILTDILDREAGLETCPSLDSIPVSGLLDSKLEARFLECLRRLDGGGSRTRTRLSKQVVGRHAGYRYELGGQTWQIVPQLDVTGLPGLAGGTRPDFVFTRANGSPGEPKLAVYLDGWTFHHNKVDEDLRKRQALLHSGRFDVWSFTWQDLDAVLLDDQTVAPEVVHPDVPALREHLARQASTREQADLLDLPLIELFARELRNPEPLPWRELGFAVLSHRFMPLDAATGEAWCAEAHDALPDALAPHFTVAPPAVGFADLASQHARVLLMAGAFPTGLGVVACLDDRTWTPDDPEAHAAWRAFLRAFQLLRHVPGAVFCTRQAQPSEWHALAPHVLPPQRAAEGWARLAVIEPELRLLAEALERAGLPQPVVGHELDDIDGGLWGETEWQWPQQRVALAPALSFERALRAPAEGWTVLRLDEVMASEDPASTIAPFFGANP